MRCGAVRYGTVRYGALRERIPHGTEKSRVRYKNDYGTVFYTAKSIVRYKKEYWLITLNYCISRPFFIRSPFVSFGSAAPADVVGGDSALGWGAVRVDALADGLEESPARSLCGQGDSSSAAVSYTHLTLPTILLV